ncbi:DNA starvation/stationary phase protection protein, partial [Bacteroidales bacterium OttesenSCG-928-C19]|nr:DNA starvation/stationary phase protection protein [Bacteroidales bacterium OttesenSCG-928-C19]
SNLRGFHWNIKGKEFYTLHEKFEEMYDDTAEKVDEIAERILMLGEVPVHNFSEYLKISRIKETRVISEGEKAGKNILESLKTIIEAERKLMETAGKIDDEATSALMSDYIREQEKTIWMLVSYFSK